MDLTTKYLGLTLKNPLVVSASPLSENIGNIKKMEEAGAAAVVMLSLFEEQIEAEGADLDRSLSTGGSSEAASYFPNISGYRVGPETYLENLTKAKAAVKIPIIASLNGATLGGWARYAKQVEQAGAVGAILAIRGTFAAEVAGCQVEIGASGAMAAAAAWVLAPLAPPPTGERNGRRRLFWTKSWTAITSALVCCWAAAFRFW